MLQCTENGCQQEANFTYVWPWGEQGNCCATHQVVVGQKATQLDRQITFTAIDPNRKPALTRDERTGLIAARMSAEQELVDVKAQGAQLYTSNTELAAEVRRFRARETELNRQLADARETAETALKERDDALADLHEAQTEVKRLQAILPRPAQPPQQPPQQPPR
jgi:chromosome segregation ATPase